MRNNSKPKTDPVSFWMGLVLGTIMANVGWVAFALWLGRY